MKKTYNINISGRMFVIDDDAYALLSDYLDTLGHAFRNNPDNSELIADIEYRIAEIFTERNIAGQQIITLADVEAIIARIGKPEDFIEIDESLSMEGVDTAGEDTTAEMFDESVGVSTPPEYNPSAGIPHKKLYRDAQDGMIGGVCAGLAAYTGMDVTWVRLITVGLCFISLSTLCIAYVILWIVLPNAETPLQRMQMRGEDPTISNIGQSVTETFRRQNGEINESQESTAPKFANGLANLFGIIGKVAVFTLMIISIPIALGLVIGFVGCLLALVIFVTGNVDSFLSGSLASLNYNDVIIALLTALGYIIVLSIPLIVFQMYALNIKKKFNKSQKVAMIATWIIGFLMAGIFTGLLVSGRSSCADRFFEDDDETEECVVITDSVAGDSMDIMEEFQ